MLSKNVLKYIQSLSLKKYRDEAGLFIAEGPKMVKELLQIVPEDVQQVYATEEVSKEIAYFNGITIISDQELEKLSGLKTPNGMLAIVQQFTGVEPDALSWTIYLDTIQDPGNLGTIIRIADWFGIKHIVCSKGCADLYNPKVVQATMASIARVNVFYDKEDSWLIDKQAPIYAAALDGKNLHEVSKTGKGILVVGNESKGIRKEFMELATSRITIPKRGEVESLNAAVATGIILSHLMR